MSNLNIPIDFLEMELNVLMRIQQEIGRFLLLLQLQQGKHWQDTKCYIPKY